MICKVIALFTLLYIYDRNKKTEINKYICCFLNVLYHLLSNYLDQLNTCNNIVKKDMVENLPKLSLKMLFKKKQV